MDLLFVKLKSIHNHLQLSHRLQRLFFCFSIEAPKISETGLRCTVHVWNIEVVEVVCSWLVGFCLAILNIFSTLPKPPQKSGLIIWNINQQKNCCPRIKRPKVSIVYQCNDSDSVCDTWLSYPSSLFRPEKGFLTLWPLMAGETSSSQPAANLVFTWLSWCRKYGTNSTIIYEIYNDKQSKSIQEIL